jgi:hypothetical protein
MKNNRCRLSYGLDNRGVEISVPSGARVFFFWYLLRTTWMGCGVQRLLGAVSLGVGNRSVKLTPHLQPTTTH